MIKIIEINFTANRDNNFKITRVNYIYTMLTQR